MKARSPVSTGSDYWAIIIQGSYDLQCSLTVEPLESQLESKFNMPFLTLMRVWILGMCMLDWS